MDTKITWQTGLAFSATAHDGFHVKMDGTSGPGHGAGPMELLAMAIAGCTGMDAISILQKKRQTVTRFEVSFHGDRAREHPTRFLAAALEYMVTGHGLEEAAVLRAIELSVTKYCPVYASMRGSFPVTFSYTIFEGEAEGAQTLVAEGRYFPPAAAA
jgi:putative redox protein